MIEVKHLHMSFGGSVILQDVNATINDGDVIAVIGPSGTGKSTLIRCLNLLNKPSSGQVLIDGEDITAPGADVSKIRQKIGMVFQQYNLFQNLTVLENAMQPQIDILGRTRQEACDIAVKYLRMVGMGDRLLKYPSSLSGGQQQRAAIARTLSMQPEIILFDEPTSALDPTLVGEVEYIIEELAKSGITMMIVTHEMRFASRVANRVFYMDEKGIYEDGTAEQIFNHPQKEKTRIFIQQIKRLKICISAADCSFPEIISRVAAYARELRMEYRSVMKLESVIEELCLQILLPSIDERESIEVSMDSPADSDTIQIRVNYSGKEIPLQLDSVSGKMLTHFVKELEIRPNEIHMVFQR